ncbi:MAG TPA: hypothetical protein VIV60_15440, partial [Polyangiaceae bacterium]
RPMHSWGDDAGAACSGQHGSRYIQSAHRASLRRCSVAAPESRAANLFNRSPDYGAVRTSTTTNPSWVRIGGSLMRAQPRACHAESAPDISVCSAFLAIVRIPKDQGTLHGLTQSPALRLPCPRCVHSTRAHFTIHPWGFHVRSRELEFIEPSSVWKKSATSDKAFGDGLSLVAERRPSPKPPSALHTLKRVMGAHSTLASKSSASDLGRSFADALLG